MKKLRSIITAPLRKLRACSPELFLILFAGFLLPMVAIAAVRGYYLARLLLSDAGTFADVLRGNYKTAAAAGACLLGTAFLAYIITLNRNNLWAVCRKMILEALHRKVVLILLLFFVILMPSLPFILRTEGSLKSQVQLVLTYSLALAEILLSVLAVFICTASVCSEINRKHVHITDTKPLNRWQFLFGKLMGTVILCGVLLFLMSASVYGIVNYMARERSFDHLPSWEAARQREDLHRLREEVLVARLSVTPDKPDVSRYVEARLQERRQRGELADGAQIAEARKRLEEEAIRRRRTAPPLGTAQFTFSGLDPYSGAPVFLRVKPHKTNPDADHLCPGVWYFLLPQKTEAGGAELALIGGMEQQLTPGAAQEIAIDPRVIDRNGSIYLVYENRCSDTGVQFARGDGIEIMQKSGGFLANYYRALVVILAHIVLLSALSIMLGAMFSFPVASFCVGALLVTGLLGPWVAEHALSVGIPPNLTAWQLVGMHMRQGIYSALRGLLTVLPQFGRFSPIEMVANGRLVGLEYAAASLFVLVFLQSGIAMVIAAAAYRRRELARIIV